MSLCERFLPPPPLPLCPLATTPLVVATWQFLQIAWDTTRPKSAASCSTVVCHTNLHSCKYASSHQTYTHYNIHTHNTHAHAKQAKCKATHACEECADNWKLVRTSSSSQAMRYPVSLAYFKCSNWISLVTNWTGNASLLHSESQLKINTWLKTLIRQKR